MSARDEVIGRLRELIEQAAGDRALLAAMRAELDRADRSVAAPASDDGGAWRGMLGRHPSMLALRADIAKFAPTPMPVLVFGESGTGKELVARALHRESPRRDRPFLSENCAAIPETLLESVLFGHVKGAFTGAVKDHPGHFLAADGGTLFLDEIGDMPLAMQAKLLRVLQEGEVRPVGGSRVRKVDVRVIAATHRDIAAMVTERRFREDLYYRLNVLSLTVPPLRERGDDVVLLARTFLAKASAGRSGGPLVLGEDALAALRRAPWPGNVRQLQNEMQRVAALAEGPVVGAADLTV